jgi:hypothetical protein
MRGSSANIESVFDDDVPAGPDLGPDERDRDLMDGSWEDRYYSGRLRKRDWHTISIGIALLALMGMTVPLLVAFLR